MGKLREKRTERLARIRLTPAEKAMLMEEFRGHFLPRFSDFIRQKLFEKKISAAHQKKFEAYIKAGNLRGELNSIGTNINQIAKRMNTYREDSLVVSDREVMAVLVQQLEQINNTLDNAKL